MKIAVVKETRKAENRVAVTPQVAQQLIKSGHEVAVESQSWYASNFSDEAYQKAGCTILAKSEALANCDILVKLNAPDAQELSMMKEGS